MTKHDRSDEKVCETSPYRQAPCRRLLVCCPENHLPSINWETKLGKQFPFGGSLPLFPACTHADCRRNYEMEESSGEAGRAPNRRSRPAPDASPWGAGPWRHIRRHRGGRERQKRGERGPPSAVSCRSSGDHAKREKVPNRT